MWVYITEIKEFENNKRKDTFVVGFYTPKGNYVRESCHDHKEKAAARVHYLNGGYI